MQFFTFDNSAQMEKFFKKNLKSREESKVEYCILDEFKKKKALFVAPHAFVGRVYFEISGRKVYAVVGDKNTGKLARLAALHTNTAYVIPKVLRTEADPARAPEDLGKGLKLLTPFYSEKNRRLGKIYIEIHKNKKLRCVLEKYNEIIDALDPKAVVFIHGMAKFSVDKISKQQKKRKVDIMLGFGKNYEGIGNSKKNALHFKKELINKTNKILKSFNIKKYLEIKISKWSFTGEKNYPLNRHVIEYNKAHKNKRLGINVEFNLAGRTTKGDVNLPTVRYQLAVQALADLVVEWSGKL
jgi:hypothetical protein